MIDKTMCEDLWRNISDFYVNLRVEVAAVSRNRDGVEKTVDNNTLFILGISNLDKLLTALRNEILCLIKS
jgi:hypothetical protein